MAGETETKLRIVGTDQTGEAFRSAAQNAERLNRSIAQGFQGQQALVGRLAGGVAGLERRLTAATAAMGVGAALRSSFTEFAATDRRMTRLAQNAEVSGKAVRQFKQELVKMGSEIGIGTENMIAGFETYVRQTGDYDKAKANIRAIGEFAHAVGAEARDAATTARVLEQSFNIDPGTMPLAFDMIATAANKGNYEAKDLARSIPELADAAAAAGLSGAKGLGEMLAMMEAISDKVAEPQQVMQGMRDMLARMSQPEMMNNFQKETGINLEAQLNQARRSGKSVSATFVQTIDVGLRNMAKRMNIPLERRNELLARLVPELDSRRAVSALLNGLPRVIEVLNAVERAGGTVKKQLKDVANDPQADIQRLEDSWDSLKQSIGQTMVSVGLLEGLKSVREEFEGIQRAAKMLDDFMAKVRTKGVLGAVFDGGGEAVRNKALINAEEDKRQAEENLKLFESAKANGETDASDGRRHGGLGIPGLGFLSPPIPVDHGIENARAAIAEAEERIARIKGEQAAQIEFDDRRARGIPLSEEERLRHLSQAGKPAVTPTEVKPMPPERRVMAPEIVVDPELAKRRAELDRLAPPGTDPAIKDAVDAMKRELVDRRPGEYTSRRMAPEIVPKAPDLGAGRGVPQGLVDPYAPPPGFQRQSADTNGDDPPWKGLIHRTALTSETTDATARGQMDQLGEARRTNEILGNMLRRATLPRNGEDAFGGTGSGGGGSGGGGGGGGGSGGGGGGGGGGGSGPRGGTPGTPNRRYGTGGETPGGGQGPTPGGPTGPQTRSGENVPSSEAGGGVDQRQGAVASKRKQAITDELRDQLAAAGKAAGVNAEVFSGGQDEHGPNRTGSHRHDHGKSADVKLYRRDANGKRHYLSMDNEADRAVMEKFMKTAVQAGATGVGAGPGYMGPNGMHIGGGSPLAWGAGGKAANAPEWVRRAHREGMEARRTNPINASPGYEAKGGGDAGDGKGAAKRGGLTALIDAEAKRAGIDPRLMHGIRAGESGHRNDYDVKSDRVEDSYGPFQLNRRGGLGQEFEEQTGKNLKDPKTIAAQARWVAEYIAKQRRRDPNWSPGKKWYGYKGLVQSDPSWGESGYRPDGGAPTKTASNDEGMSEVQGPIHPDDITKNSPFAGAKEKPKRWVQDPETGKWKPDFENDGSKPGGPDPKRPIRLGANETGTLEQRGKPTGKSEAGTLERRGTPTGENQARTLEEGGSGFKKGNSLPDFDAARQKMEEHRREMERPIRVRYETDSNSGNIGHRGPVQARREQEASMKSARYGSFSDVGVA